MKNAELVKKRKNTELVKNAKIRNNVESAELKKSSSGVLLNRHVDLRVLEISQLVYHSWNKKRKIELEREQEEYLAMVVSRVPSSQRLFPRQRRQRMCGLAASTKHTHSNMSIRERDNPQTS